MTTPESSPWRRRSLSMRCGQSTKNRGNAAMSQMRTSVHLIGNHVIDVGSATAVGAVKEAERMALIKAGKLG